MFDNPTILEYVAAGRAFDAAPAASRRGAPVRRSFPAVSMRPAPFRHTLHAVWHRAAGGAAPAA
jgi:hypothetical protein